MTKRAAQEKVVRAAMLQTISLLEYDAASYDLSARYASTTSSIRTFKAKERERRRMIKRLYTLARHRRRGK